jgi:hypothetical protein
MSPAKPAKIRAAAAQLRPARLVVAALLVAAPALGGCSYQLGSLAGDDTTGSISPVRPLPKGAVDPAPNDPYRVDAPARSAGGAAGTQG